MMILYMQVNLIGLSKCAEQLGFNCQAVKGDREGFLSRYTLISILDLIQKRKNSLGIW